MGKSEEAAEVVEEVDAMASRFLLVEASERRAAVPLGDVLRIERIPLSRVEYIGYRPVLNFQGQLLPIEDSAGVFAAAAGNPDAQITVVVCREGNRHVGIAVSHVLDVAAGNDLFEAGSQQAASGVTLLKEHVTGIVDLASIQSLPGVEQHSEWNSVQETVA